MLTANIRKQDAIDPEESQKSRNHTTLLQREVHTKVLQLVIGQTDQTRGFCKWNMESYGELFPALD